MGNFRTYSDPNAQAQIKSTFLEANIADLEAIQSPVHPKVAKLTTKESYVMYGDVPWVALVIIATIIIVLPLIMMVLICYTWAK